MFLSIRCRSGRRLVPLQAVVEVLPMMRLEPAGGGLCQGVLVHRAEAIPVFDTVPEPLPMPEAVDWQLVVLQARERLALVVEATEGVLALAPEALRRVPIGSGRTHAGAVLDATFVPVLDVAGIGQ